MKNTTGKCKRIIAGAGLLTVLYAGAIQVLAQAPESDVSLVAPDETLTAQQQPAAQQSTAQQSTEQSEQASVANTPDNIEPADAQPVFAPTALSAAGRVAAPVSSPPKVNPGANLLNLVLGLLLIIGLIFALSWLVRRMGSGGLLSSNQIKVVAAMPLGTRERIVVVEVGGQQLLLGITATQINTLHVFSEPVIDSQQATGQSEFGKKLMAVLQQKSVTQPQSQSATEPRQ